MFKLSLSLNYPQTPEQLNLLRGWFKAIVSVSSMNMAAHIFQYLHFQRMRNNLRRERLFRERMNPFEFYDEGEFQQRFRFRKDTVMDLIEMLRNDIHPASRRVGAIPSHLQVLLALRLYATGQFQREVVIL